MSKKKKKLNKKLIEQRLRELEKEARQPKTIKENQPQVNAAEKTKANQPPQQRGTESDESDKLILKDLKKVGMVVIIVLIIFAVLFFINLKTDYILTVSDKILTILHVGQL